MSIIDYNYTDLYTSGVLVANSGQFYDLRLNNVPVSVSGHLHSSCRVGICPIY